MILTNAKYLLFVVLINNDGTEQMQATKINTLSDMYLRIYA